MRLWTLHPKYLDTQGLVALWREALLARAVLRNQTRGYTEHPQLERFKGHAFPRMAINAYLAAIHCEATSRGYSFDRTKIGPFRQVTPIFVTSGQVDYEWEHLLQTLAARSPTLFVRWRDLAMPDCHPLFHPGPGSLASWERAKGVAANDSFRPKPLRGPT